MVKQSLTLGRDFPLQLFLQPYQAKKPWRLKIFWAHLMSSVMSSSRSSTNEFLINLSESTFKSTYCYNRCCSHRPGLQHCTNTCHLSERFHSRKNRSYSLGREFLSCSCSRASQDNSNPPICLGRMSRKASSLAHTSWKSFRARNGKSITQQKRKL